VVSERFDAREEAESGVIDADTTDIAPPDTSDIDN